MSCERNTTVSYDKRCVCLIEVELCCCVLNAAHRPRSTRSLHYRTILCPIIKLKQRFQHVDRICTAIDDYAHRSKTLNVEGWGCPRVQINLSELRSDGNELSQRLRNDPLRHMRALEAACHGIANEERPGYDKDGT